ncbi:hypothetical protein [Methanomethylovorans sp.]|uniref:hypothetical protein n=1 Tax=Methanomethylovorans sp. TaxID=2758717 RepID=UPI00351C23D6
MKTVEEDLKIAKGGISADVTESDIYQMGRWWIVSYTVDGTAKQRRIDAYTRKVIPDLFNSEYTSSGQYGQRIEAMAEWVCTDTETSYPFFKRF